jgi:pSer/pThr/pTyr-binding forkhead associated (FHA) protein
MRKGLRTFCAAAWRWVNCAEDGLGQLPLLTLDWTGAVSELVVGRSSSCDLVLRNLNVSRPHARLFFREGKWILQDLESTNGTYINGTRVRRSELRAGDILWMATEQLRVD